MNKVYDKEQFTELARQATLASGPAVQKRWRLPIIGSLKCIFAGADDDVLTYKTPVHLKWEFSSKHVAGSVVKTMHAAQALGDPRRLNVPLAFKLPITAAYIYKHLAKQKGLAAMKRETAEVRVHAIAASKVVKQHFRLITAKRKHETVMAPVCAHVADDKYLCCLPNTTTNHLRGFLNTGLKVVSISDQEAEKAPAKKKRKAEAPPEVAGVVGLSLPKDVKAYNKKALESSA